MEGSSQTSFIPKKPLAPQPENSSYSEGGVSVVTIICVILFFGMLALSAGTYLYRGFLNRTLVNKKETLEKARSGFDVTTIRDLKRLDTRIEESKKILDRHIALSRFFTVLQSATLKTVRFSNLTLSQSTTNEGGSADVVNAPSAFSLVQFRVRGTARSYTSVALQSDQFGKTKGMKDLIFSGIALDDKGNVNFDVSALFDAQLLRYRAGIGAGGQTTGATSASQ